MKMNKFRSLFVIFSTLTVITVLMGQGCGGGFSAPGSEGGGFGSAPLASDDDTIKVIPNTKTASVSYARQIVDSMVSCTGIKQSTDAIKNAFNERKGSLSEYGSALEISAPMLMSSVAIAGEVCNQLITDEKKVAASQRRIFTSIDFNRAPGNIGTKEIGDVVRRISHSCWSRKESTAELDIIVKSVNEAFSSGDKMDNAMLMLCTGMLSSLSGLEI